jgi:hypothetical protein
MFTIANRESTWSVGNVSRNSLLQALKKRTASNNEV